MNKKGQFDYPLITFVVLLIFLLIFAPIFIKILTSTQSSLSPALGNMTHGEVAQKTTDQVLNTTLNLSDKLFIFLFALFVIILLVSSFLIDTHPFWIFLYIIVSILFFLFAPNVIASLDSLYSNPNFASEVGQLTFLSWLRDHFGEVLVGVMVLTGIIIYGKVALFRSGGGGERA